MLLAVAVCAGHAGAQVTPERIDKAIADGVKSLLATQRSDGSWGDYSLQLIQLPPGFPGRGWQSPEIEFDNGQDVFGLVGLAYGGLDVKDKRLQKALGLVLKVEPKQNYVLAGRIIALAKLYPRLRSRQQELARLRIAKDVNTLISHQSSQGTWGYERGTRMSDMRNTAMVIAALGDISATGKSPKTDVWAKTLKTLLDQQRDDGGWNLLLNSGGGGDGRDGRGGPWVGRFRIPTRTAGGTAGMLVMRQALFGGGGCPCKGGKSSARAQDVTRAVERGLDWVNKNINPGRGRGGLSLAAAESVFFLSRVGLMTGQQHLAGAEWYPAVAGGLTGGQDDSGGWGDTVVTALAIATLASGREPVLLNKLQFDGPWDLHPGDAAALAAYVAGRKDEPMRWQAIGLDAKLEELHEAPILYISAERAPRLSDEHKKALRTFTDTGGTVLFEASCGNEEVVKGWAERCKEIWPAWEPKLLEKDHPLWSAEPKTASRRLVLKGVDDGVRTCAFISERDLSCLWQSGDTARARAQLDLGTHLYAYATDRGTLRSRWLSYEPSPEKYAEQKPRRGKKESVAVARVRHAGDWSVADNYRPWQQLAEAVEKSADLKIDLRDPAAVGQPVPQGTDVLYLTGRASCDLGEGGPAWLTTALDAGTFLLAEATLGDARFDESFRAQLQAAGLALKEFGADSPPVTGKLFDATGYRIGQVGYSQTLAAEREAAAAKAPAGETPLPVVLHGIYAGSKLVGIYSPTDLLFSQTGYKAYGNRGYAPEDAQAVAANILLLVSVRYSGEKAPE